VQFELTGGERVLAETGLFVAALVHLLVPGALLAVARVTYRGVLRVEFDPKPGARRRVRLVGLVLLTAVPLMHRLTT
jgi:hypothetical protein